jgi:hypothetical protein
MRRPGGNSGQLCKAEEAKVEFWGCLFLASAVFRFRFVPSVFSHQVLES